MEQEHEPSASPERQIKNWVNAEPRIQLLNMALDDEKLKYHLFVTGRLAAEDAGEGCSYSPDGTPRIDQEVARRMGLMIIRRDDISPEE